MSAGSDFKDLFSSQSADYARFRPGYPDSLFQYLSELVGEHELAWDCGTGNGQAALKLTPYFRKVLATDISPEQLAHARRHPQVEYRVSPAERTEFKNESINLITVAQAFHWFQKERFLTEALRVLKPQGVLALWSYGLCHINSEIAPLLHHLYEGILGPYWEPERKLVEDGYREVALPLEEIPAPPFEMTVNWSLPEFLGYLRTWSALQAFIQIQRTDPLLPLLDDFHRTWGEPTRKREIRWPLALRLGRQPT